MPTPGWPWPSALTMANEPPTSPASSSDSTRIDARNTPTVASQSRTKSMYTGFQRPSSVPRLARSTSRLR